MWWRQIVMWGWCGVDVLFRATDRRAPPAPDEHAGEAPPPDPGVVAEDGRDFLCVRAEMWDVGRWVSRNFLT